MAVSPRFPTEVKHRGTSVVGRLRLEPKKCTAHRVRPRDLAIVFSNLSVFFSPLTIISCTNKYSIFVHARC
jgi:hypothetical protein